MWPAISKGNAIQHRPVRPDRPEALQEDIENGRGRDSAVRSSARRQHIEQPTGSRRVGQGKQVGPAHHGASQPIQQGGAPRPRPAGGYPRVTEKPHPRPAHRDGKVPPPSARSGSRGSSDRPPRSNQRRLASASPSGTHGGQPGGGVTIPPLRPSAGIEQHGSYGEIERSSSDRGGTPARPRAARPHSCRGAALLPRRSHGAIPRPSGRHSGPQILPLKHKMPPPRVKRRPQRRIPITHDSGHKVSRHRQPIHVDSPTLQGPIERQRQHATRRAPHRRGRQQRPSARFVRRAVGPLLNSP